MINKTIHLVDLMGPIVAEVAAILDRPVYFQHGHPLEIINNLKEMTAQPESSDLKYPLVALFQDFEERKGERVDHYSALSLHLIIATLTEPKLLASERYTQSFKPILQPIYEELLQRIHKSSHFTTENPNTIPHVKIDRLYWGREGIFGRDGEEKMLFNDYIDAIEIRDLKLILKVKR